MLYNLMLSIIILNISLGGMPGLTPAGGGPAATNATNNNPFAQLDLSSLLSQYGATPAAAAGGQTGLPVSTNTATNATSGVAEGDEAAAEEEGDEEEGDEEGGEEGGEEEELNAMEALLSVGALEDPVGK